MILTEVKRETVLPQLYSLMQNRLDTILILSGRRLEGHASGMMASSSKMTLQLHHYQWSSGINKTWHIILKLSVNYLYISPYSHRKSARGSCRKLSKVRWIFQSGCISNV